MGGCGWVWVGMGVCGCVWVSVGGCVCVGGCGGWGGGGVFLKTFGRGAWTAS